MRKHKRMGWMAMKKRIIVGISGASGAILAVRLLEELKKNSQYEVHLIVSECADYTLGQETGLQAAEVTSLADVVHPLHDMGASVSSGTFQTEGMVIIPCSMKTVAGIASGYSDNLLLRSADVTLKEGRKLVLVARESPLSRIHLRNLLTAAEAGATILPPMLTYYNKPVCIEDMTHHIVCKVLSVFGIECEGYRRWE